MAVHKPNIPNASTTQATPNQQATAQVQPQSNPGTQVPPVSQGAPNMNPNVPPFTNQGQPGVTPNVQPGNPNQPSLNQPVIRDWLNLSGSMGYAINVSPNGTSLVQLSKAIREHIDDNIAPDFGIDFIEVDKDSIDNLAVSVIIVTAKVQTEVGVCIGNYTYLIESSIEPFPSRYENINGKQIEVSPVTGDAYDQNMRSVIDGILQKRYPGCVYGDGSASVIPRGFVISPESIRALVVNAIMGCRLSILKTHKDFVGLNIAEVNQHTAKLSTSLQFAHITEQDIMGTPVRADIILLTTASSTTNNNNTYIPQQTKPITRATGYIDLLFVDDGLYTGNNNNLNFAMYQNQMNGATPIYQANLVLTSLNNYSVQSLDGVLLALLNASFVRENDNWLSALMPVKGNEMHDIGNIGYDISVANDGNFVKMKTTPDTFTVNELIAVYKQFFRPGLAISIDVPFAGPGTWEIAPFGVAAAGGPKSVDARLAIRRAANNLTNGLFDRYYRGDNSLVTSPNNIIDLGYYESKEGKKDIRDLDYLAVAGSAGKRDRGNIATYTESFNSTKFSTSERLFYRKAIATQVLGNVTLTGRAIRVDFEAAFISALLEAAVACGYSVIPQHQAFDSAAYRRDGANYINNAVLGSGPSGIFRQVGFANNMNNNGFWQYPAF